MERIGLAASKIAKGNLLLYNLFVILISFLFALLIFFMSGFSVLVAIILIAYATSGFNNPSLSSQWWVVVRLCLMCLAFTIAVFNLIAILKNIKLKH